MIQFNPKDNFNMYKIKQNLPNLPWFFANAYDNKVY